MIIQIERRSGDELRVVNSGLDGNYTEYVFRALAKQLELEQQQVFASAAAMAGNHRVTTEIDGADSASLFEECRCASACFSPRGREVDFKVVPFRPR